VTPPGVGGSGTRGEARSKLRAADDGLFARTPLTGKTNSTVNARPGRGAGARLCARFTLRRAYARGVPPLRPDPWIVTAPPRVSAPVLPRPPACWVLVLAALVVAAPAWALSWTCPRCGHTINVDPRDPGYLDSLRRSHQSSHGTWSPPPPITPPPPPRPSVDLTRAAHAAVKRLAGAMVARDFPALEEPATFEALDGELAGFIRLGEQALEREAARRNSLQRRIDSVATEIARLDARITGLERANDAARRDLAAIRSERDKLRTEARELRARIRESNDKAHALRAEIREVMNRLFPRLWRAEQRGWLLAPGAFRPPPIAPEIVSATSEIPARPLVAATGLAKAATQRASTELARAADTPRGGTTGPHSASRETVQAKINRLETLSLALTATRSEADARARQSGALTLDLLRRQANERGAQEARAQLAGLVRTARGEVDAAKETLRSVIGSYQQAREHMFVAWAELAIYKELDRRAEAIMEEALGKGVNLGLLLKLRAIGQATTELGTDIMYVVQRFPAAMIANGESLEALRRDLDAATSKFHLSFASTYSDVPEWVIERYRNSKW
jgi:hypothetical protein